MSNIDANTTHPEFIFADPYMGALCERVRVAAAGAINVLLLGETGVGKEVFAEMVHRHSKRARGPFLGLNCSAFAETMLESELFGHEAGAFTGARKAKPGLLEVAAGGTVFLDEVGELPMTLQAKLLRVFDERQVLRVGGICKHAIDVRFVAATNRDLDLEVARGRFRQDLLFRLNGISFRIPPLRQRRQDIAPLAELFLHRISIQSYRTPMPRFSEEALKLLEAYDWPGNVRQLRNIVERAAIMSPGVVIRAEDLQLDEVRSESSTFSTETAEDPGPDSGVMLRVRGAAEEEQRIRKALELCGGNQTQAALRLGISRRALGYKMDRYKITRPRQATRSMHEKRPKN